MLTQAAFLAWSAILAPQTPPATVDLALRVPEGSVYEMKVVSRTAQVMEGSGLESANGSYTLTLGQRFAFGRTSIEGTPLNVTNTSVEVVVDGQVDLDEQAVTQSLNGLDMAFTVGSRAQTLKLEIRDQQADQMRRAIVTSQTDLLKQTGPFGLIFPTQAVSVGSTWTHEIDLGDALKNAGQGTITTSGDTKAKVTYKVTAIEQIEGKTVVKIQGDITGQVEFVMTVSGINFKGTSTTTSSTLYTVDAATGVMLRSESTGTAESKLPVFSLKQNTSVTSVVTPAP